MASPMQTRKKTVDLAAAGPRVSRIRRDPPPKVKEITEAEVKERDAWDVALGVTLFALALFIIMVGFGKAAGWSPSQYTIVIRQDG